MNHSCKDCSLGIPYPKVENITCDNMTMRKIYRAYTGNISELGAISEYSYQTLLAEENFTSAADMIECISIVEMKHFHILGEIIVACGLNPVINFSQSGSKQQKAGSRLPKVDESWLRNTIMGNISAEKNAIEDYESIIETTDSNEIKAIIERIILDERHHIELFKELLK